MSVAIEKEFNQFHGILREHPEITVENMFDKMKEGLDDWKERKINMAFFGPKKQGKTSLIEAFRGSSEGGNTTTENKAGFSSTERPEIPTPFTHPENPNITLWYFPNLNMDNAKESDRYVKMVAKSQIKPDAFFCLIASTLTPETKLLVKVIQKLNSGNKPLYFIKSKIDSTVGKKVKSTRPEDEVKRRVRDNLLAEFESVGIKRRGLNLFLVDSRDPTAHEFSALQEKIVADFKDEATRTAWAMALRQWRSKTFAQAKFKALESRIAKVAFNAAFCEQFQSNLYKQLPGIYSEELQLYLQCFRLRPEDADKLTELKKSEQEQIHVFVVNELNNKDLRHAMKEKRTNMTSAAINGIQWQNSSISHATQNDSFTSNNVSIFEHVLREALVCARDVSVRTMEKIATSL